MRTYDSGIRICTLHEVGCTYIATAPAYGMAGSFELWALGLFVYKRVWVGLPVFECSVIFSPAMCYHHNDV